MVKTYWKLYYRLFKPKNKSEIVQSYCRINGINYASIAMSAYVADISNIGE